MSTEETTNATASAVATESETETGLPKWLDELLKPGVSNGVFMTLKLCLVGLILVLGIMLSVLEDPTVRMHLSIFLGMTCLLFVLVVWFIGELQKATAEQKEAEASDQKSADAKKLE